MALQSFQLDPDHRHRYRKVIKLSVDKSSAYITPEYVTLVNQGEVWVTDDGKANAVGLRTKWRKTGQPE